MTDAGDDLVTAVAAVLGQAFEESINEFDVDEFDHAARAVLVSGLVVSRVMLEVAEAERRDYLDRLNDLTSAVNDLAQQWDERGNCGGPDGDSYADSARELRALTRQENPK